ncbi:MAG: hypothetical protein HQK51_06125 [Oligoflexia bacterium]|nr:hypothetical protein [Oligoflexia bacterium]
MKNKNRTLSTYFFKLIVIVIITFSLENFLNLNLSYSNNDKVQLSKDACCSSTALGKTAWVEQLNNDIFNRDILVHSSKDEYCKPNANEKIIWFQRDNEFIEWKSSIELLRQIKSNLFYPQIPKIQTLHLPIKKPVIQAKLPQNTPSSGVSDKLLEEARVLAAFEDYKLLSDARPKKLSTSKKAFFQNRACRKAKQAIKKAIKENPSLDKLSLHKIGRKAYLNFYISNTYDFTQELRSAHNLVYPKWSIHTQDKNLKKTFNYIENNWNNLVKETSPHQNSSLLKTPYPVIIPAGRFQEPYYWDSYFGVKGLLSSGRLEIAQMQVENFLDFIQRFGLVPNGGRDYYLSRSQPPFLSSLIKEVYDASILEATKINDFKRIKQIKDWLAKRAYPLLKLDYKNFWMNSNTRYDEKTGLNHHWDSINLPRPERHSFDNESKLGNSYRDVRASAESGLDFTETLGKETSSTAGVLLNSMLYKTEKDLEFFANELDISSDSLDFKKRYNQRHESMDKYLWNAEKGCYNNYNLKTGERIPILSADTFTPLYVGMVDANKAKLIREKLTILEKNGGIMSSELTSSPHQWDGNNGWAPFQMIAMQGLKNYGYEDDAKRIAQKWTNLIAKVYIENGAIYERMDVDKLSKPEVDESKYPPQQGFLWTNSSFVWALKDILQLKFVPNKK